MIASENRSPEIRRFIAHADARARQAGLRSLASQTYSGKDFELRVWLYVPDDGTSGFVIQHKLGYWSGLYIPEAPLKTKSAGPPSRVAEPNQGWEKFWQQLLNEGILSLVEEKKSNIMTPITDGLAIIVESNSGSGYKAQCYINPWGQDSSEARRAMRIVEELNKTLRNRRYPETQK